MTASAVAERLDAIRARIASAGRDPNEVTVIAVTKGFGSDAIADAVEAGLVDIGENYAQELLDKARDAPSQVHWHFLGAVQRNKVERLAQVVTMWHGVDRLAAGKEIAKRRPGASVLVQVNVSGAEGRNGCSWADAPVLVAELRELALDVAGLMAVATASAETARGEFERLAALRHDLGLRELSAGMSDDLEIAVAAGSTMVRVGRALFGARFPGREMRR